MTLFAPGTPPEVIEQVNSSLGMSSPSSVNTTTTSDVMGGSNPATTKPFADILAQLFGGAFSGTAPSIPSLNDQPLAAMPPPQKSDDGSGGYKAERRVYDDLDGKMKTIDEFKNTYYSPLAEPPSVDNGGMKTFDEFKDSYSGPMFAAPSFAEEQLKTEYDKYKADFNNPATPSSGASQPTSAQGPSLDYLGQMLSGGLGGYGMYQPQPQRSMFGGFGMPMMQPMYGMGMGLGLGGYGGFGGMSPYGGGMGYGGFGGYGGYGGGMSPFGMGLGGYGGYGGGMPYGNMYGGGFYNTQPQVTNTQSFAGESPFGAGSLFGSLGSIAQ